GGEPLANNVDQPRLADSRLSHEHHALSDALLHQLPALDEKAQLLLASDERQSGGRAGRDAVALGALAQYAEDVDRIRHATQRARAERLAHERPAPHARRGATDER